MPYSIEEFDFELPEELIASQALSERSASRMLVVDRRSRTFDDTRFAGLPGFLREGDVLVLNNTRVFPARLFGRLATGANVEIFLVEEFGSGIWSTLARPAKRLATGKRIDFGPGLAAEVLERDGDGGTVKLKFESEGEIDAAIDRVGRTPLPPYIKRKREMPDTDRERYQTVFARERGAIAAPTAGLHFTPEILDEIRASGVAIAEVTLHVGYGTFEPVRVTEISRHRVQPERYSMRAESADLLNAAKAERRRIVAVGTTTTRTLEYNIAKFGNFAEETGHADLTILPGYDFRAVDALLTNFHLPKSSLLFLVSAFAGSELIMDSYRHAVRERYRFYSYGDCMFIH
jgi:S-adenosylmethionine:tRNA ribosyltransferase-isomerase